LDKSQVDEPEVANFSAAGTNFSKVLGRFLPPKDTETNTEQDERDEEHSE